MCVCDQHVGRVCTAQAVRRDAGVIVTPRVITSPAAACVQQAGEDHAVRKVILEHLLFTREASGKYELISDLCIFCCTALCWQTRCNLFLFLQSVCPVGMGGDALSAASVLEALPVTM